MHHRKGTYVTAEIRAKRNKGSGRERQQKAGEEKQQIGALATEDYRQKRSSISQRYVIAEWV